MRQWRKRQHRKSGWMLLLGVMILLMALARIMFGQRMGAAADEMMQTVQEQICVESVSMLSPAWGYVLKQELMQTESVSQLELLMKAEQGQTEQQMLLDEILLLEEQKTASQMIDLFPEDRDEPWNSGIEWDASLQAEIDRENEMLRELARQQELERQEALANQQAQMNQQQSTQQLPLPYAIEQLSDLQFLKTHCYTVHKTTAADGYISDVQRMMEKDMKLQAPDSDGPKVLIHHTHATEYFADSDERDPNTLIVGVGDYLEQILTERYGIAVIHDETVYPYNEAYSKALENIEQILAENPSIEVMIDLHRDAGGGKKYTVEIDGKETANLMFFNGLSHNVNGPIDYLSNPNLEGNLAFSFQMKMAGDSLYPGLCKKNYLKAYRYNLHVLPRAVIVEVGDNNNTLQEAKNAMEPLAKILNYVLTGEVQ